MGIRPLIRLAAFALSIVACGDDGVAVRVVLPEAYRGVVELMTVDVLEPEGGGFGCDAVAFGERNAAELQSVTASRASFRRRDGLDEPIDIARRGRQLVVVRGFSAEGEAVVAGCAARDGEETSALEITAAAMVRLEAPSPLELFDGKLYGPMPDEVIVTLRDFAGSPLPDTLVRWSMDGAGGFIRVDEGSSTANGQVAFVPTVGALFGPYRLRARSPWAFAPTPELISYESGDVSRRSVPGVPSGLVALGGARGGGSAVLIASLTAGSCPDQIVALDGGTRVFTAPCHTLGLARHPTADVPVLVTYGADAPRLQRIDPTATPLVTDCGPVADPSDDSACVPLRIVDADPCEHSGRTLIVFDCPGDEREQRLVDTSSCPVSFANGSFGVPPNGVDVRDSGCVAIDGAPTNVFVAYDGNRDLLYTDGAPDAPRAIAGVTRVYELGKSKDSPFILGLTSNAGALGLARFTLLGAAGGSPFIPDVGVSFATPREPVSAASADLDGDGVLDVFALANGGTVAQSRIVTICLGRDADVPLCAEGPTLQSRGVDLIALADINGDAVWEFAGFDTSSIGAWELAISSLAPR